MYKNSTIHFIGIGGIGMSGIAKILKQQGYMITGCDIDLKQKSIKELIDWGCKIYNGNNTLECQKKNYDILVYSSAIKKDNEEIIAAQKAGIPTIERAQMLWEIMRTKYSIAITGSHGKTTTTSIISHILIENQFDPTVIIGGHLKNISTNARLGNGNFIVAEADESDKSLLKLYPTLAVVTNIDKEHLDNYKDIEDIRNTFKKFLENIPFYGKAFLWAEDPNIESILPLNNIKIIKYGFDNQKADIYAKDIKLNEDSSSFNLYKNKEYLGIIDINLPGKYNILNSLAAISVSLELGIKLEGIKKAIKTFSGVEKRFSFKKLYKKTQIFDDYAHHPTEIFNVISVARKKAKNKLIVIFQPHRYSRTYKLWQDFINLFAYSPIDSLVITDIYPAGESPTENVNSLRLVNDIKFQNPTINIKYINYDDNFISIRQFIDNIIEPEDLILTIGAGKLDKLTDFLN